MSIPTVAALLLAAELIVGQSRTAPGQFQDQSGVPDITLEHLLSAEIDTVFGASRYRQRVTEAPASVSIVTREEIEQFGYRTFGDVLRGVRGFYVSNDRNYSYLGTRGFSRPGDYNTRVLVLIDGHRLNDNVYDAVLIGTEFPLDIDLIERIEFVRGPGSSLYGTNAVFAVVNVVTRRGAGIDGLHVSAEAGNLHTGAGSFMYGRSLSGGGGFAVSGSGFHSAGEKRFEVPGVGIAHDMDGDDAWRMYGSYQRGPWSLQALALTRDKHIPTGAYGTVLDDRRSHTTDGRAYVDLAYEGTWRGSGVLWRAAYDIVTYDGQYVFADDEEGTGGLYEDGATGQWISTEALLSRRMRRHFLTAGFEYRNNFEQSQFGYDVEPLVFDLDDRRRSQVLAGFVQDELSLSPRLSLTLGVRHDWYTASEGSTNFRAAAIVRPLANASLKFLYGSAFRAPNVFELFYYPPVGSVRPETVHTIETVWEQYFTHLRVSASAFRYGASDLINQVAAGDALDEVTFANVGKSHAKGVEFELEGRYAGVQTLASYTLQEAERLETGVHEWLTNSPRHIARGRAGGALVPRLLFYGLEGLYLSERRTLDDGRVPGVFLANLTVTTREIGRLKGSFMLGNLFDRAYADPGGEEHASDVVAQPGRTVRAKITWRF
jgi:iron complex outermembrane receptor protein